MTIEQAIINIEKELKCRQHRKEEIYCENTMCMDCPFSVGYEDLTDTLQTLYDWVCADYDWISIKRGENK